MLKAQIPAALVQMLRIPGLGPKKVMALYNQLHIDTLEKLEAACNDGRVAAQRGFGEKTAQKILEGLKFLSEVGGRVRLDQAMAVAAVIVEGLRGLPELKRLEVCGSIRRRKETVKDVDVLASCDGDPTPIMDRFVGLPGVIAVTGQGPTKSSIVLRKVMPSGASITL